MVLHIKKKRIVVRIRKDTVIFFMIVYLILLLAFVAYLGGWGDRKQYTYTIPTEQEIIETLEESGLDEWDSTYDNGGQHWEYGY